LSDDNPAVYFLSEHSLAIRSCAGDSAEAVIATASTVSIRTHLQPTAVKTRTEID